MSDRTKYIWNTLGMTASCFLPCVVMFIVGVWFDGDPVVGVIVGAVIAVPLFIYFIVQMIKYNKRQVSATHSITASDQLPKLPIKKEIVNMDSNFIFPELTKIAQPYFEDLWKTTNEYGWINVMYEGDVIMQIWNLPLDDKKKNVVLNYCPYSYEYSLVQRFKNCAYYQDFAALDSEEDNYMQAAYGTDIVHALKVASYILTEVYNIPTSYPLDVQAEKPLATW